MAIDEAIKMTILQNALGLVKMGLSPEDAMQEALNHEEPLDFGKKLRLGGNTNAANSGRGTSSYGGGGDAGGMS